MIREKYNEDIIILNKKMLRTIDALIFLQSVFSVKQLIMLGIRFIQFSIYG